MIRDVEWETDQQTIQDALLKIIPDTMDDFWSEASRHSTEQPS
jgi:hypothetical protein